MKKSLLALAAMGAFAGAAQAQSSVTVYGVLDKAYSSMEQKVTASSGATTSTTTTTTGGSGNGGGGTAASQNYTTERIGFRGTEDLGGGLTASFTLEMRIGTLDSADSGTEADGLPVRQSNISIASKQFGSITVGRQTSLMENAFGAGNSSNQNNFIGTLYYSGQKFNNSRSDRLVTYASPTFNGFAVAAQIGRRDVKTTTVTGQDEMALSISYANGPLTVNVTHLREETKTADAVTAKPEATVAGANYNFGPVAGFVTYAQGKNNLTSVANDRSAWEVGARAPVTKAVTLQASTYRGTDQVTAAATKSDVSGYQFSALYNFSKRTNLYAVIGADETKNDAGGTKTQRSTYGVGARHTF